MEKMIPLNQKKHPKNKKKKQPLKVVYISNPIKFNISASEFRALVQELTGQDADTPESASFSVADGGRGEADGAVKVAAVDNVHAVEEVTKMGLPTNGEVVQKGSDPSVIGSYDDVFVSPGLVGSTLLDVLTSLDAM
ncbi:hypothetical protein Pfo_003233 [Paulownia fortunei]|nr:hypothetical protein Pfo_003233 [Paulownia fortunei]